MYLYLYDNYLKTSAYNKKLAYLEASFNDLGLLGKKTFLDYSKRNLNFIEKELNRGVSTIVIIGDDTTLDKTIYLISQINANYFPYQNIFFAIIPITDSNNQTSEKLGITYENACNTLAQRRILKLNSIMVNREYHFITNGLFENFNGELRINNKFNINVNNNNLIKINNLNLDESVLNTSPTDNLIDLVIYQKKKKFLNSTLRLDTVIKCKNIKITNNDDPMIINNSLEVSEIDNLTVAKNKLNMIVGKDRIMNS